VNPDLNPIVRALDRLIAAQQKGVWDYIGTGAVVLTIVFLIWYTYKTYRLRKAAQEQTVKAGDLLTEAQRQNEASQRLVEEAQNQNETALRPIVALTLHEILDMDLAGRASTERRNLRMRNLGNGPAFNVTSEHLSGDGEAKYVFFHPDIMAKDEDVIVYLGDFDATGNPLMMNWEAIETVIFGHHAIPLPQMITINYRCDWQTIPHDSGARRKHLRYIEARLSRE
jgi:hypothetical protein